MQDMLISSFTLLSVKKLNMFKSVEYVGEVYIA